MTDDMMNLGNLLEKTPIDLLFGATGNSVAAKGVYAETSELYDWDQPEEEAELTANQLFEKLFWLEQLRIFCGQGPPRVRQSAGEGH